MDEIIKYTTDDFWEIGASGRKYNRDYVIESVANRYSDPDYNGIHSSPENEWEITDFMCREIGSNNYLVTYTLNQGDRITRRSAIWRLEQLSWKIVYHQGTVVEDQINKSAQQGDAPEPASPAR